MVNITDTFMGQSDSLTSEVELATGEGWQTYKLYQTPDLSYVLVDPNNNNQIVYTWGYNTTGWNDLDTRVAVG